MLIKTLMTEVMKEEKMSCLNMMKAGNSSPRLQINLIKMLLIKHLYADLCDGVKLTTYVGKGK